MTPETIGAAQRAAESRYLEAAAKAAKPVPKGQPTTIETPYGRVRAIISKA